MKGSENTLAPHPSSILFPLEQILKFILELLCWIGFSAIGLCFSCILFCSQNIIHQILRFCTLHRLLHSFRSFLLRSLGYSLLHLLLLFLRNQGSLWVSKSSSQPNIHRDFGRRAFCASILTYQSLKLRAQLTSRHIHFQCVINCSIQCRATGNSSHIISKFYIEGLHTQLSIRDGSRHQNIF